MSPCGARGHGDSVDWGVLRRMRLFLLSWLLATAATFSAFPLQAAEPAAPVPSSVPAAPAASTPLWVATWAAAARDYNQPPPITGIGPAAPASLRDQTVRLRVLPAVGGGTVRVRLSNVFGTAPLHIRAASVARSTGADALSPRAIRSLRFDGKAEVTLAPGAERWSDAVRLAVQPQQALALSLYVAEATRIATVFSVPAASAWIVQGDATRTAVLRAPTQSAWGHVVTGIDVARTPPPALLVAFGDSITQGTGTLSYPERLAQRLRGPSPRSNAPSVVNAGIGGNRLLADGTGPRALDRFERDVLQQSGVTHTLILIGVNDIGRDALPIGEPVPLASMTTGLQQLIDRARSRGVKVLLGTLTPVKGSVYYSEATEAKRQALNRWIRGRQDVDGVVDFDAALRDRGDAQALAPAFDSGDHLHPSDAGYAAMAAAVDVHELKE